MEEMMVVVAVEPTTVEAEEGEREEREEDEVILGVVELRRPRVEE